MITFVQKGDFKITSSFLERALEAIKMGQLDKYGKMGVKALADATPVDTGETAASWDYRIVHNGRGATIEWFNTHENKGVNIAIILQYGHGTGTGGYVQGRDYINPAMRPVFDKIADEAWKEVVGG